MSKFSLFFPLLFFLSFAYAQGPAQRLAESRQLVMVSTANWDSAQGQLQRYQRDLTSREWRKVGEPIPVVVGKKGMAWGVDSQNKLQAGKQKKEGDLRTPVGVYWIGPAFGYAAQSPTSIKIDYFSLKPESVCVDDEKSQYYNQLFDSTSVSDIDWRSAEKMRETPLYKIGGVIQYNMDQPSVGRGSCIFLHIWRNPAVGTAGCIAMEESALNRVLAWLDPDAHPVIALLPRSAYPVLRKEWHLPPSN